MIVGLTHTTPRKESVVRQPEFLGRTAPDEVTKLGELLPVAAVELKLRGWVDDNPSIEFPLAEDHRSTYTRVFCHDRLC